MPTFVARCRRRARWGTRAAVLAGGALLVLLAHVHIHSAVHSNDNALWDRDGAFASSSTGGSLLRRDALPDEGSAGGASGLGSLIRSLGGGRQAASTAGGAQAAAVLRVAGEPGSNAASGAPMRNLPPALAGTGTLFITFGNSAVADFIDNWVLSVQRLGLPYVVGALDRSMGQQCKAAGHPHIDLWRDEGDSGSVTSHGGDASFFRTEFKRFRSMGATKVNLALSLLQANNSIDTVVVSDADAVWLHDPRPYFQQHPAADWLISTDCLSVTVEEQWAPGHQQPRCGHIPGNIWGRAYNTGIFVARNCPTSHALLAAWRDALLDPSRTITTDNGVAYQVTDQLALNMLLEQGNEWELKAAPEDKRVILLWNSQVKVHPLPVALFPGGHVAFVQRSPWRHKQQPYVVHATFQRYPTDYSLYGKRGRFREFGMWLVDGQEYFAPPGVKWLTYQNTVLQYVEALSKQLYPETGMPLFYRQIVGMSYQLALFRDALAAARMLNRTLVLPTSWCWCDYDWTPHVLERCKIRGSDLRLPFECPADYVFYTPLMDLQPGLNYRVPGFLEDPRAPAEVRTSRAQLQVLGGGLPLATLAAAPPGGGDAIALVVPAAAAAQARLVAQESSASVAAGLVQLGSTQEQLLTAAKPLEQAAVIELSHMQPGLLSGFTRPDDSRSFDAMYRNITQDMYWCCGGNGGTDRAMFWYSLPQDFSGGQWQPWQPPLLTLPSYCQSSELSEEERQVVAFANHPCQFLTNPQAAAISAALS
ncbi:glycosyltransferase family 77 [Chlorella sorokiniana]|uniref:Glycosyltransferase n=1 Tax=Chlorella sorokiniana TaxID=3076 RepID=A0A2P6TUX0_CHLSO|nr:glycosyltransferase family 77 [Chlorella sorokiniana]|eukprot:PRW57844.1 glycosyltransferase family 77 [Chlorella sorokiniana]